MVEGAWSRFKPGLGKDKRGVSGVDRKKLIDIGKKISSIPGNFNVHNTLKKIFDFRMKSVENGKSIDWSAREFSFWYTFNRGFFGKIVRTRLREGNI